MRSGDANRMSINKTPIYSIELKCNQAINVSLELDEAIEIRIESVERSNNPVIMLFPSCDLLDHNKTYKISNKPFSLLSITKAKVIFYAVTDEQKKIYSSSPFSEDNCLVPITSRTNNIEGVIFSEKISNTPIVYECYKKVISLIHCIQSRLFMKAITPIVFFTGSPGSGKSAALKCTASLLRKTTGADGARVLIVDLDPNSYETNVPGCLSCYFYGENDQTAPSIRSNGQVNIPFMGSFSNGQCAVYPIGITTPECCFSTYLKSVIKFMNDIVCEKLKQLFSDSSLTIDEEAATSSNLSQKQEKQDILCYVTELSTQIKRNICVLVRLPSLSTRYDSKKLEKQISEKENIAVVRDIPVSTIEESQMESIMNEKSLARIRDLVHTLIDYCLCDYFNFVWADKYDFPSENMCKPYNYLNDEKYDQFYGMFSENEFFGEDNLINNLETDFSFSFEEEEENNDSKNKNNNDNKPKDVTFSLLKEYVAPIFFNIDSEEICKFLVNTKDFSLSEKKKKLNLVEQKKMATIFNVQKPLCITESKLRSSKIFSKEKKLTTLLIATRIYFNGVHENFLGNRTKTYFIYPLNDFKKTEKLSTPGKDANSLIVVERKVSTYGNNLGAMVYTPDCQRNIVNTLLLVLQENDSIKANIRRDFKLENTSITTLSLPITFSELVKYLEKEGTNSPLNNFSVIGLARIEDMIRGSSIYDPIEVLVELPSQNNPKTLIVLNTGIKLTSKKY